MKKIKTVASQIEVCGFEYRPTHGIGLDVFVINYFKQAPNFDYAYTFGSTAAAVAFIIFFKQTLGSND